MKNKKFKMLCTDDQSTNEINLTPLIDTILVILIIFILLLPQVESSFHIILPTQQSKVEVYKDEKDYKKYFSIFVDQHGQIFIKNKVNLHSKELYNNLIKHIKNYDNAEVIIFADKDALLEKITDVMDIVNQAGIKSIYIRTKK